MMLNDAVELAVANRVVVNSLMPILKGLNWDIIESWLERNEEALPRV